MFSQIVIDSLIRAAQLGLVAMGLTVVYALVKFANIAHVEFATVGAFIALAIAGSTKPNIAVAALVATVLVGFLGFALQHTVF